MCFGSYDGHILATNLKMAGTADKGLMKGQESVSENTLLMGLGIHDFKSYPTA